MHLVLEFGFIGIILFIGHFLIHAFVWEALKMGTKHIYRKIRGKKCDPECKYDKPK